MKWLIWSNEHQAWWREGQRGYAIDVAEAGRYEQKEALKILKNANEGIQMDERAPNEILVPDEHARHYVPEKRSPRTVYTLVYNPFTMGGPVEQPTKTKIKDYELVNIGAGYKGMLFQNPHTCNWHVAEYCCGALIGTAGTREGVLKQVRADVAGGSEELMKQQVADGLEQRKTAREVKPEEWFKSFKK